MPTLSWSHQGQTFTRPWISESQFSAPKNILIADDRTKADDFYQMASQGAAFVYLGDFQNAKQLLQAVERRIDKKKITTDNASPTDIFNRYRQGQAHKAQLLARLLIPVEGDLSIPLSRAPDVKQALTEALEKLDGPFVISLRELLGTIGAHEWRKKGVRIETLDGTIHPHYGIFSPVRGEYLNLIATAPLPAPIERAFDIGTGTGVIAALLAKRGVKKIIATDLDPRALACAQDNILRLGFSTQVEIQQTDLFPGGLADLIVCNPPWLPARPTSRLERAVYDEKSQMLKGFLAGLAAHLTPTGEGWLIMSDLAERLGLRGPTDLEDWIQSAQLQVVERLTTAPTHNKSQDQDNPLYPWRSQEKTHLWRLKKAL